MKRQSPVHCSLYSVWDIGSRKAPSFCHPCCFPDWVLKAWPRTWKSCFRLLGIHPYFFFLRLERECPPSSDKEMLPPTIKGKARRGRKRLSEIEIGFLFHQKKKKKAEDGLGCVLSEGNTLFRPRWYDCRALSSFRPRSGLLGRIAVFGLCLPLIIKNSGLARESAGNKRKEGVHVAAAPAPFLVNGAAGSASTRKERIHFR